MESRLAGLPKPALTHRTPRCSDHVGRPAGAVCLGLTRLDGWLVTGYRRTQSRRARGRASCASASRATWTSRKNTSSRISWARSAFFCATLHELRLHARSAAGSAWGQKGVWCVSLDLVLAQASTNGRAPRSHLEHQTRPPQPLHTQTHAHARTHTVLSVSLCLCPCLSLSLSVSVSVSLPAPHILDCFSLRSSKLRQARLPCAPRVLCFVFLYFVASLLVCGLPILYIHPLAAKGAWSALTVGLCAQASQKPWGQERHARRGRVLEV